MPVTFKEYQTVFIHKLDILLSFPNTDFMVICSLSCLLIIRERYLESSLVTTAWETSSSGRTNSATHCDLLYLQ